MAMPLLSHHTEKLVSLEKLEKKSNLNSLYAFLVFIIIMYISTFYIFNLSPSTLMRTTKFWFIMSNALILIIAADSGAFSLSKSLDFYTKNNPRPTPAAALPYFQIKYERTNILSNHHHHAQEVDYQPREKIIGVVASDDHNIPTQKTLEKTPQLFLTDRRSGSGESEADDEKQIQFETVEDEVVTSSESGVSEENEFSRMSDEEVNRRVEEFIRRFNRQIRLQAATNRRPLA